MKSTAENSAGNNLTNSIEKSQSESKGLELEVVSNSKIEKTEGNLDVVYFASFDFKNFIRNDIYCGGSVYTGDKKGIYANIGLSKYKKMTKFRKKISFFKNRKLISTEDRGHDHLAARWSLCLNFPDNSKYNTEYGYHLLVKDNNIDLDSYKKDLITQAITKGLKNYPGYELISEVFKPIDDSIRKIFDNLNKNQKYF
jgi:hypothetical protein